MVRAAADVIERERHLQLVVFLLQLATQLLQLLLETHGLAQLSSTLIFLLLELVASLLVLDAFSLVAFHLRQQV